MSGTVPAGNAQRTVSFTVTVLVDDIDVFLSDPLHRTAAVGTVQASGLTTTEGAPIVGGKVRMLARSAAGPWRCMDYELGFRAADGRPWTLRGRKLVTPGTRLWSSSTTLYTTLAPADSTNPEGVGVLRLSLPAFLRQLTTVRGSGRAMSRYGAFFLRRLLAY